jgi:DNA-directed RNA polymerase subunit RPC12/RpoP
MSTPLVEKDFWEYECVHCGNGIRFDDEYLKTEDSDIYCENCFKERIISVYSVGGEYLGTDDDIAHFYSWEREEE